MHRMAGQRRTGRSNQGETVRAADFRKNPEAIAARASRPGGVRIVDEKARVVVVLSVPTQEKPST